MAAALERAQGRYVAGGTAAGGSRGSRELSDLAAAAFAHASGIDVPVGREGPRHAGFRHLDEDGHAVHRYVVPGAGLENYSANDSARAHGPRRVLATIKTAMHLVPTQDEV